MYNPPAFREDRPDILYGLIREARLALLVSNGATGVPDVTHLPMLLIEEQGVLLGHLARAKIDAADGFVVLSSRVSVEMVQKSAMIGVGLVVAVSAPTALGVRMAEDAGITLVAIARGDGFEVFTHPQRVVGENAVKSAENSSGAA